MEIYNDKNIRIIMIEVGLGKSAEYRVEFSVKKDYLGDNALDLIEEIKKFKMKIDMLMNI